MKGVTLFVGTSKGLYVFRSGATRTRWRREGPHFVGEPIYHAGFDPRDGSSVYVATNQTWGGPRIEVSRDVGRTWTTASNPKFPEGSDLAFARTWHIEPGHATQPDVVWAGVEPAALFRSDDRGMTWQPVPGMNEHKSRSQWSPGNGGLGLHSIAIDARDAKWMAIGISAAGVFESRDGGKTWGPANKGIRSQYIPDPEAEIGHCIHHLVAHPGASGVRFQKVHDNAYWREGGDSRWTDVTAGLPSEFGFAAAIHPHDAATAYTVPLDPRPRLAPEPGIAVYRTRDRGQNWKRMSRGLPRGAQLEVLREGLTTDRLDPAGVYFGSKDGGVWASADEGTSWRQVAAYLPPVLSVTAATT